MTRSEGVTNCETTVLARVTRSVPPELKAERDRGLRTRRAALDHRIGALAIAHLERNAERVTVIAQVHLRSDRGRRGRPDNDGKSVRLHSVYGVFFGTQRRSVAACKAKRTAQREHQIERAAGAGLIRDRNAQVEPVVGARELRQQGVADERLR